MQTILNQEGIIRMAVFLGVMVAMMVLEAVLPRRQRGLERRQRWPANLGIVVADTLLARLSPCRRLPLPSGRRKHTQDY